MSSDVYFSIYEDEKMTNLIENIGVGHLAVLNYFGFDAKTAISRVLYYKPVITTELISRLKIIIRHAHSSILIDKNLSEEEFVNCYGYLGPHDIEWDDIIYEDEMEEALKEFIGKYISIGVD